MRRKIRKDNKQERDQRSGVWKRRRSVRADCLGTVLSERDDVLAVFPGQSRRLDLDNLDWDWFNVPNGNNSLLDRCGI